MLAPTWENEKKLFVFHLAIPPPITSRYPTRRSPRFRGRQFLGEKFPSAPLAQKELSLCGCHGGGCRPTSYLRVGGPITLPHQVFSPHLPGSTLPVGTSAAPIRAPCWPLAGVPPPRTGPHCPLLLLSRTLQPICFLPARPGRCAQLAIFFFAFFGCVLLTLCTEL